MLRILVADDSELFRRHLVADVSTIPGVEVVGQASDGPTALDLIETLHPEIVVLDIRMPGGNGIDALHHIHKREGRPVVIMLTNYSYPQYRNKCMEAGADYFFDKAVDFEEMLEIIRSLTIAEGLRS